jgi:hypothetical protein
VSEDYNPSYKEGIRQDRIIGKDLANRPGGRAGKRRTSTSKPSLKNVYNLVTKHIWR